MNNKSFLAVLFAAFFMVSSYTVFAKETRRADVGEAKMLDVSIEFYGSYGKTITNGGGVEYHVFGLIFRENKVYIPSLWGEFPLYFFDTTVGVRVRVHNRGPKKSAKIMIKTISQVLHTNGSAGFQLAPTQEIEIEVARGETKVIDRSFLIPYSEQADSGLDLFTVKVLHQNKGGGKGNEDPSLIMAKRGVFCPPKFKP